MSSYSRTPDDYDRTTKSKLMKFKVQLSFLFSILYQNENEN